MVEELLEGQEVSVSFNIDVFSLIAFTKHSIN